jgi:hypothetical protein
VKPLSESEIRASFVNCSKGEAKRLQVPRDLDGLPWDDLDYLGWVDPRSPARRHLVAELDGTTYGLVLRANEARVARRSMCSLCITVQSGGVSLMVAPRAGRAGQQGNSLGTYICSDLACSLYVRGRRSTGTPGVHETLTVEQRAARLVTNLEAFVRQVTS